MADDNRFSEFKFTAKDDDTIANEIFDQQERIEEIVDDTKDVLAKEYGGWIADIIVSTTTNLLSTAVYFIKNFGQVAGDAKGVMTLAGQESMKDVRPTLFQLSDLGELFRRGEITESEYIEQLKRQGFSADKIEKLTGLIKTQPDVATVISSLYKNCITATDARQKLHALGFEDNDINLIICSAKRLLTPEEILMLWLRSEIDEAGVESRLNELGFLNREVQNLKKLAFFIPPVQDLITMSVKEVFDPIISKQFGQYEEFPQEFESFAHKQGISTEWAKRYWAGHWQLPSIGQGFEMLHRGVITDSELGNLLKALDVMPFWRDKLTDISYNPLTRVDVRRMHDSGVIDKAGVKRAYLDVGYSDKNADLMTEFTLRYNALGDRELSKAEIINAWEDKLITRVTVNQHLLDLEYPQDQIDLLLLQREFEQIKKLRKSVIESIRFRYTENVIKKSQAEKELLLSGVLGAELASFIIKWDVERNKKVKDLSKEDLTALYTKKLINRQNYIDRLTSQGYTTPDAELLEKLV